MQFWPSRNGGVQMFFLTPNRNMAVGKFLVNSERFFGCVARAYYFKRQMS